MSASRVPLSTRRLAGLLLVLAFVVVLGLASILFKAVHDPLPTYRGRIELLALDEPVEVYRDEWGVAHIYATSSYNLFFAQGYTQAQDRWWQMDYLRHLSQGRLGELVGEDAFANDVAIRALDLQGIAKLEWQTSDPHTANSLQAFSDGINAYLEGRAPRELAFEYTVLNLAGDTVDVSPWSPIDTLTVARYIDYSLSIGAVPDVGYGALVDGLAPEQLEDFLPPYPYESKPTILPQVAATAGGTTQTPPPARRQAKGSSDAILSGTGARPLTSFGSSWAVSGRLTLSGKPLLANDLHTTAILPSLWYEVGLHCEPVDAACPYSVGGFTIPTMPAVLVGHNRAVAWGISTTGADVADYYQLEADVADQTRYRWDDGWRSLLVREETFSFADGSPTRTLLLRRSHLGPVVSDPLPGYGTTAENNVLVVLSWTGLEPRSLMEAVFSVALAQSWTEFKDALDTWALGSLNFVYADIYGNIGYQMAGSLPLRAADQDGEHVVVATGAGATWRGLAPPAALPSIFNPANGFIVAANQAVATPDYWEALADTIGGGEQIVITPVWADYGYRAQRIGELVHTLRPHSVATFSQMQVDDLLVAAREMMPYLQALPLADAELDDARDWLVEWNAAQDADCARAVLYAFFWARLVHNLYDDELEGLGTATQMQTWPTTRLLASPENAWWDDLTTVDVRETRDMILERSLAEGLAAAQAELGNRLESWQWGTLHTVTFVSEPFGATEGFLWRLFFKRGPYPVCGGANTVNDTSWSVASEQPFAVESLPSLRMIVDLSDLGASLAMHTTGQSGHVGSAHYDDMITSWCNGDYHGMIWAEEPAAAPFVDTLLLTPVTTDVECCER